MQSRFFDLNTDTKNINKVKEALSSKQSFRKIISTYNELNLFAKICPTCADTLIEYVLANKDEFKRLFTNEPIFTTSVINFSKHSDRMIEFVLTNDEIFKQIFHHYGSILKATILFPKYEERFKQKFSNLKTAIDQSQPPIINEMQKYYLCEWISGIYHCDFVEKGIDAHDTLEAFKAMLTDEIINEEKQRFIELDIWNSIEKVRAIFRSDCPQRNLNLTQYNVDSEPFITKEGVFTELKELIEEKIGVISDRQLSSLP